MKEGIISGDGRSGVHWKAGDKKANFMDKLGGTGKIESVKYTLATFTIEANYCMTCKKIIFELILQNKSKFQFIEPVKLNYYFPMDMVKICLSTVAR